MKIEVGRTDYAAIEPLRGLYRQEANCQIIHDSWAARGLADLYALTVDGRVGGYACVGNRYSPDRIVEFYVLPHLRPHAQPIFAELLRASKAKEIEAQTNLPLSVIMTYDFAKEVRAENVLFGDAFTTDLRLPGVVFRESRPGDVGFPGYEPDGDWVLEVDGQVVASGGFLCHYNPPYGDVYMAVAEGARRRGYGAYLVQEVKRVCLEAGKRPAARCNPDNVGSRKTLEKAGFVPVARLLVGTLSP
ncbi:MAG: GNAT family N-acetyltransferase [Fimbriimonas sp.]